jgi:two-component system, NtrC family, response regulator AtoC
MTHRDVLVVDDDDATRALLLTLFSRAGLTVVTADDGEQALTALDQYKIDAVVLDLFMPRLNGTDFLAEVARTRREMLSHVIVLSAGPESVVAAARQQYPIWCAMRKPTDITDLMENVLDCLLQPAKAQLSPRC